MDSTDFAHLARDDDGDVDPLSVLPLRSRPHNSPLALDAVPEEGDDGSSANGTNDAIGSRQTSTTGKGQSQKRSSIWADPFRRRSQGTSYDEKISAEREPKQDGRRDTNFLRRTSVAAMNALESVDIAKTTGNPLGLKIGERKRLSSVAYASVEDFDGRRRSTIVSMPMPRKPSVWQKLEIRRSGDDPDDYIIRRLAKVDDIELMTPTKRMIYRISPIFVLLATVFYWAYFALRIRFTLNVQHEAHKIFGLAWAFIGVEIGVAIPMVLHRFWTLLVIGGRKRPKLRLEGPSVPSVDVVITCCGEDDSLVLDTAMAACDIDYPTDRFRVIISDDKGSQGLREITERCANEKFDNLYYRSREKIPGVPHHFKAGNLNYILEETKILPGGAANFLAALDADMIPEKDWLRAILPHMLQDSKCSMACPPQQFYNIPIDDPLSQSLDTFVHISEPVKDALGVAWCTGSGYILRREAMDEIGGFPIGSLAEDVCTSSMLLGAGWNTAFVHEPLQWGTVPESLTGHLKQRTRWTIGTIQTALKLRFCLFGILVKHMTIMQRLSGFVYTISSLFTFFLVAAIFTVPVVLISGGDMVPFSNTNELRWLLRFVFFAMITNRLNEFAIYMPTGYRVGQQDARGMMWMAPYHALSVFHSFILPSWLGGKVASFTSSGSQKSELNERNPKLRAPLHRRLKVTLWDCQVYLHLAYILFVIASIVLSSWHCFQDEPYNTPGKKAVCLLTHGGWPPILWLASLISYWTPIQYALFPPSMPEQEELMHRDPKTGVVHPTENAKKIKSSYIYWLHEVHYTLLTAYATGLFILSFFLNGQVGIYG